jgi:hypothetical protein
MGELVRVLGEIKVKYRLNIWVESEEVPGRGLFRSELPPLGPREFPRGLAFWAAG